MDKLTGDGIECGAGGLAVKSESARGGRHEEGAFVAGSRRLCPDVAQEMRSDESGRYCIDAFFLQGKLTVVGATRKRSASSRHISNQIVCRFLGSKGFIPNSGSH